MHELSLANRLVEEAAQAARDAGATRVTAVMLRVGDLSGVSIEALQFAYDVASAGTLLDGSRLVVRRIAVTVYCPPCEQVAELASVQSFRCPACGTPTADIRTGRELEIESIEVEEPT